MPAEVGFSSFLSEHLNIYSRLFRSMKAGLMVVTAQGSGQGRQESNSFWEERIEYITKLIQSQENEAGILNVCSS